MAPNAALVRDSPAARWLRRSAPFWILLGITCLIAIPGMLVGPNDRDTAADRIAGPPAGQFASSDDPDPRRWLSEQRGGR